MNQLSRVECNLQKAEWEQVKIISFSFHILSILLFIQNGLFSLNNIMFDAHPGDLICIIGPVGSGKVSSFIINTNLSSYIICIQSSLLQTLTGEIAFFDGKVRLHGSFCYVPQEPCKFIQIKHHINDCFSPIGIFSSTVKKNILFGEEYDSQLFRRVVHAAALEAVCSYQIS